MIQFLAGKMRLTYTPGLKEDSSGVLSLPQPKTGPK